LVPADRTRGESLRAAEEPALVVSGQSGPSVRVPDGEVPDSLPEMP